MDGARSDGCFLWNEDLGRYDFDKFTVLLARHNDRELLHVTGRHEYVHLYLTVNTTFGWLLKRMRQEAQFKGGHRGRLLTRLADACRTTQEAVATYDSLTGAGRQDLLTSMPSFYRDAFRRCAAVVDRTFDTTLLRSHYAVALGRCAMMTKPGAAEERIVEELISGKRIDLPDSHLPDVRFARFEEVLRSLPEGAAMEKFREWIAWSYRNPGFETCSEAAIADRLGANPRDPQTGLTFLESSMVFTLCELLEDSVPGLSDSYSDFRLRRGTRIMGERRGVGERAERLGIGYDQFEMIRDSADQTVTFVDGPVPPIEVIRGRPEELAALGESSVRKTGSLYLHVECTAGPAKPACFLVDLKRERYPVLRCYQLDDAEGAALRYWTGGCITIVEADDLRRLRGTKVPRYVDALLKHAFIHVTRNPVDLVADLLGDQERLTWTATLIAYTSGTVRPEHRLELVLYKSESFSYTLYHLSNPILTTTLTSLTESIVADDAQLAYLPADQPPWRSLQSHLTWLVDHPVWASFHMLGREIRVLDSG